jgi:ribonuclease P protein component
MDHRLRKDRQFTYIYKKGVRKNTHFLTLFIKDSKFKGYKIGYSVSKKIGKANVRNKLKRRMKEIVRTNDFAKDYHNYVLMARQGIENLTFEQLFKEIKEVFNK